jgi:hypothetical protein
MPFLDFFGSASLIIDNINGAIVFSHTKASVEELFYKFVDHVCKKHDLLGRIAQRNTLVQKDYLTKIFHPSYTLDALQRQVVIGHRYRIAYNHSSVDDNCSELVGFQINTANGGDYRVIFCTSIYAAGVNLRNFNQVFIEGDHERVSGGQGRKCRPSELAQMAEKGARWGDGFFFTLGFTFDDQFEQDYFLSPINEKTPRGYKLSRHSAPTFEETLVHIVEIVAHYVGRSMRAVSVTFIDDVIRFLICEHHAFFTLSPREQRYAVTVADARMLSVSKQAISAVALSGNIDGRNKPPVTGV